MKIIKHEKICFLGSMGSGKSTGSEFLINKYGYERASLAAPVKELEKLIHDQEWQNLYTTCRHLFYKKSRYDLAEKLFRELVYQIPVIPREKNKPRTRYQIIGTDIGRVVDESIWVDYLLASRNLWKSKIVIDDARFANEVETLRQNGFKIIKLNIKPEVQRRRLKIIYDMTDEQIYNALQHKSEQELLNIQGDFEIESTEDLMELLSDIEAITCE